MKKLILMLCLFASPQVFANEKMYLYTMFHEDNGHSERLRVEVKDLETCLKILKVSKLSLPSSVAGDYEVATAMFCGGRFQKRYGGKWNGDK